MSSSFFKMFFSSTQRSAHGNRLENAHSCRAFAKSRLTRPASRRTITPFGQWQEVLPHSTGQMRNRRPCHRVLSSPSAQASSAEELSGHPFSEEPLSGEPFLYFPSALSYLVGTGCCFLPPWSWPRQAISAASPLAVRAESFATRF